jgi:hypothetical protein
MPSQLLLAAVMEKIKNKIYSNDKEATKWKNDTGFGLDGL